VLSDELAGYSNAALRRICYRDPATCKDSFSSPHATACGPDSLPCSTSCAGKIEKAYDVFKNKLKVRKAWGSGETCAMTQAHFVALLHNLLTLLLARLEKTGLQQNAVEKRAAKRFEKTPQDKRVPTHEMIRHAFPLTCQFIRIVRNVFRQKIPWEDAYLLFKQRLHSYL